MTGLEGPITIASARGDRLEGLGRGDGLGDPLELDPLDLRARPARRPGTAEGCARRSAVRTRVRTGCSLIGSTRRLDAEGPGDLGLRAGAGAALVDEGAAVEAGREVAVGEVEPVGRAELDQAVEDGRRVPLQAAALGLVDLPAEPVGDEVGVGGDVGAEDLDVVGGVGDDRQAARPAICCIPAASLAPPLPPARTTTSRPALQVAHAQWSPSGRPVSLIPAWVL